MKCSNCGFENNETAKFCNECGEPLANVSNLDDKEISEPSEDLSKHSEEKDSELNTQDISKEVPSDQATLPLQLPVIYHNGDESFKQGSPKGTAPCST